MEENGIDAIETTYTILRSQNLLQLQPYALRGPLFVMSSAIVMNYDAFHTLPSDYQEVLKSRLSQISQSAAGRGQHPADQRAPNSRFNS